MPTTNHKINELLELQHFALEHIKEAIFVVDADARITYVNKAASTSLGYSKEELLSMHVFDLDPLFPSDIWQEHWCYLQEHKNVLVESKHRSKTGNIIPVEVNANYFEYNGVGYNMALVRDISERKRVEDKLHRQEQHQRMLLDNFPYFVWLKDKESRLLAANNQYARVAKVENPRDLVGKTDYDFFPHDLAEKYVTDDRTVMANGVSKNVEEMYVDENGERHWMETWKSPLIVNQEIVGTVGCSRDITEWKNHQEMLRENEQKFLKAFMNSPVPLAINDLETSCYIDVNDSFLTYTGYEREEVINRNAFDGVNIWCELADRETFFTSLHKNGIIQDFDFCYKRKDGTTGYASVSATLVSINGRACIVSQNNEITERKKMEQKLAEREREFRALAEQTPDTIARYDHECRRLYANPALSRAMGLSIEEIIGKKPTSYFTSPQAKAYEEKIKEVISTGIQAEIEYTWPDASGQILTSLIRIVPETATDGVVHSVLATGHDITERKHSEQRLHQALEFSEEIINTIPDLLFELDVEGTYLNIWAQDETLLASQKNHLIGKNIRHILPRDSVEVSFQTMREVDEVGQSIGNTMYINLPEGRKYFELSASKRKSSGTYIILSRDVTDRKRAEQQIEHMAHHDALTGLANRTLAKIRAEQIMLHAKRTNSKVAFLFIDLDGFKAINDTLGHSVGDLMLKTVSSRLKESIRECDTISRQGGDEFLLILSDIRDNTVIASIAQKILTELEKPFEINTHILSISGSIGIALYPDHGENFETLLQSADTAMYKAKDLGKNSYHFYTQQMTNHMIGQFKIQNDLKNALENKEFILFYQPQIDLSSNRIIGVEALIRWQHPIMGMIPPMSFIPIAESSGLIVSIGQWVIEESCHQVALWQKKGIDVSVAVNISAMQFKRGNLEEIVKNALRTSEIDPHSLELELTESIIMHDADNTLQSVRNLKALGVQLSIDDFGTGYSSLSYLKRFAVDKLKIDQSFVRDILQDRDDAAIVKTIVQMAKNLNLITIAEGVENREVLSIIEEFGCDEVQGYHFAKPMPADDFELYHKNFDGVGS